MTRQVQTASAARSWAVRDHDWFNLLVLYPVRDLMGFFFWAASYTSSKIWWRGRKFQLLAGGKMREAGTKGLRD